MNNIKTITLLVSLLVASDAANAFGENATFNYEVKPELRTLALSMNSDANTNICMSATGLVSNLIRQDMSAKCVVGGCKFYAFQHKGVTMEKHVNFIYWDVSVFNASGTTLSCTAKFGSQWALTDGSDLVDLNGGEIKFNLNVSDDRKNFEFAGFDKLVITTQADMSLVK